MKRVALLIVALIAVAGIDAYAAKKIRGMIMKKNGRMNVYFVGVDARGTISFIDAKSASPVQSRIKKSDYVWAYIEKTDDIEAADKMFKGKNYTGAAAAYGKLADQYKFVGWQPYCVGKQGKALVEAGQKDTAIAVLAKLKDYELKNERIEDDLMDAYMLLATLYIEKHEYAEADPLLGKISAGTNGEQVAFAMVKRGDILSQQNKKKEAVLQYLQAAILFDKKNKFRPQALLKAANTLKELKDARSDKFAKMLKADYPKSSEVSQLK